MMGHINGHAKKIAFHNNGLKSGLVKYKSDIHRVQMTIIDNTRHKQTIL